MKKLIKPLALTLLIIVIAVFLFSYCSDDGNILQVDLKICGSYAVPGMFYRDLKGMESTVQVIENDSYGRVLFEYKTRNYIFDEKTTVYVICQKRDFDYVYYYEDICYSFILDEENNFETLKEQNDWDCELNESKMSRRSNDITFDLTIMSHSKLDRQIIKEKYCTNNKVKETDIKEFVLVDYDSAGNALRYVYHNGKKTFFIVDSEYNIVLLEITEDFDFSDLAEFKRNNGWKYGF